MNALQETFTRQFPKIPSDRVLRQVQLVAEFLGDDAASLPSVSRIRAFRSVVSIAMPPLLMRYIARMRFSCNIVHDY